MRPDHPILLTRLDTPCATPPDALTGPASARIRNHLFGGWDNHARDRGAIHQAADKLPLESAVHHWHMALLKADSPSVVAHLRADISRSESVLASREILGTFNWREPVVLLFGSVLHHIDHTLACRLSMFIDQYEKVAVPGGALIVAHATADFVSRPARKAAEVMTYVRCPVHPQAKEQVALLFDDWHLVSPGLTEPQALAPEHAVHPQAASYTETARREGCMPELCRSAVGAFRVVSVRQLAALSVDLIMSGDGHPGIAVTDVGRHVCAPEYAVPEPFIAAPAITWPCVLSPCSCC